MYQHRELSRRRFLWSCASVPAALSVTRLTISAASDPWAVAQTVLSRIQPPAFPDREFLVTQFGARPDGKTDCTQAFRKAILACHQAGGGRVVVPAGEYLTGPIHLLSGVNLFVAEGATIRFVTDPKRYLPVVLTRFEGVECMNYSPLIYAYEARRVAVTGKGVLDGQAGPEHWWPWKGRRESGWREGQPHQEPARQKLFEMAERDVPVKERVFGEGSYLRPSFIEPYRCQDVLIEGVTIRNSPMWVIHPVLCRNVTVRGVTVESHGPNNDGCNPECSQDVLIENCSFNTGDDCIAIKSGRNRDGRRVNVPSENIVIRRCRMKDGHGGVTIGSETSGGVRYVFAEECVMDSPRLDRVLRIKTNSVRGGTIEHIYLRRIQVGQVADAVVHVDLYYEEGDRGQYPPTVRDIEVRDLTSQKSRYALYLRGYPHAPIQDIRLVNCVFENVARPNLIEHVRNLAAENVTLNGQPWQLAFKHSLIRRGWPMRLSDAA